MNLIKPLSSQGWCVHSQPGVSWCSIKMSVNVSLKKKNSRPEGRRCVGRLKGFCSQWIAKCCCLEMIKSRVVVGGPTWHSSVLVFKRRGHSLINRLQPFLFLSFIFFTFCHLPSAKLIFQILFIPAGNNLFSRLNRIFKERSMSEENVKSRLQFVRFSVLLLILYGINLLLFFLSGSMFFSWPCWIMKCLQSNVDRNVFRLKGSIVMWEKKGKDAHFKC